MSDRRRPVGAGLVLAGRAEPERHDVDEHEAGDDRAEGEQGHAVDRRRREDGQRDERDHDEGQVVGGIDEREPEAPPGRGDSAGARATAAAGRIRGDADPLEDPCGEERPDGTAPARPLGSARITQPIR